MRFFPLLPLLPLRRLLCSGLGVAVLVASATLAWAGPGHDHADEAAPAAGSRAAPRFSATSELFELVGVLEGQRLTLYLDHAASNEPVKNARLELEIGGVKVAVQAHAEGEFEATLESNLKSGVLPVTATVTTAQDSDLLAGEFDLHEDAPQAAAAPALGWQRLLAWGGGVFALLVLAGALAAGLRARRRRRPAPAVLGGAA